MNCKARGIDICLKSSFLTEQRVLREVYSAKDFQIDSADLDYFSVLPDIS